MLHWIIRVFQFPKNDFSYKNLSHTHKKKKLTSYGQILGNFELNPVGKKGKYIRCMLSSLLFYSLYYDQFLFQNSNVLVQTYFFSFSKIQLNFWKKFDFLIKKSNHSFKNTVLAAIDCLVNIQKIVVGNFLCPNKKIGYFSKWS